MSKANVNTLLVGKSYLFKIKNQVSLDAIDYFILEHKEQKFMLEANDYRHYHFQVGQNVTCKIDKVNCAGKMFIEPKHPHFEIDKTYSFKVLRNYTSNNFLDESVWIIEIEDQFGVIHHIPNFKIDASHLGKSIQLKIKRIKKGKLFFFKPELFIDTTKLEIGKVYTFKNREKRIIQEDEYLIVVDESGQKHALKLQIYKKYKLLNNDTIEAKVVKFNSENRFILEPKHPIYNVGEMYNFEFSILKEEDNDFLIEFHDKSGLKYEVLVPKEKFHTIVKNNIIRLYINNIRKSVLEFDI